jgi:hypothetical protein
VLDTTVEGLLARPGGQLAEVRPLPIAHEPIPPLQELRNAVSGLENRIGLLEDRLDTEFEIKNAKYSEFLEMKKMLREALAKGPLKEMAPQLKGAPPAPVIPPALADRLASLPPDRLRSAIEQLEDTLAGLEESPPPGEGGGPTRRPPVKVGKSKP